MGYRVVVEPRARTEVEGAFAYIAQESSAAASRWYDELHDRFASLSVMPKRFSAASEPELASLGVRQLLYGRYRVLFTVNEESRSVHVHHVRHGARRSAAVDDFEP